MQGHYAKQGQEVMSALREFRVAAGDEFELGQQLTVEMFAAVRRSMWLEPPRVVVLPV